LAPILNKSIIKSGLLIKDLRASNLITLRGFIGMKLAGGGGYKYSRLGGMLIHPKVPPPPPEYFFAFLKIDQHPFISVRREVMWNYVSCLRKTFLMAFSEL